MPKSRRYGGVVVLLMLAAAVAGGYFWWKSRQDKGPAFYTTQVTRGELIEAVTATGTIKPFLDVLVSSQISGYVNSLGVDFNSKVKKGDLLATLLPTAYEAAVQSAKGDLANSRANAQLQEVTLKRDKELLDKSLMSQSDYDTQVATLAEANAQIEIKEAALETAENNLSYCRITSPIDGVVISRNVDIGNSVAATLSSPTLFEIGADLTQMQIDAAVSEADIGNVADGQDVNFSVDAYPNRTFTGKVYQIRNAPSTQQSVVIYDVMITVANPDLRLKPGMTATVSIIVARRPSALRLANSAIRFRMPDNITVAAPAPDTVTNAPAPAPAKKLTPEQRRRAIREIMAAVGYTFGPSTPPTAEMVVRMKELAAQRGVEIPDRLLYGPKTKTSGTADAPIIRTVYVLPDDNPDTKAVPTKVRLGITDGTDTEVLGGLKEGETVVIGLNEPASYQPTSNPFSGRH